MRARFFLCCLAMTGLLLAGKRADAGIYDIHSDIVGDVQHYIVKDKETLYSIARKFDIGIIEIVAANPGVDVWIPPVGSTITIPTSFVLPTNVHDGIVVDLAELRLFYFPDTKTVVTFPLGTGMEGWSTPTGTTTIVAKREHPTWTAPDSIIEADPKMPHFIPAGPDNPLGDYAMNLGWTHFLIHGTNKPYGIGRRSSHGCMRLYPEDIQALFGMVDVGTVVTVIDAPYKLGWQGNTLFLQVTPSQAQASEVARDLPMDITDLPQVYGDIRQMAGAAPVDWKAAHDAVRWRTTIPVAIATREQTPEKTPPEKTTAENPVPGKSAVEKSKP